MPTSHLWKTRSPALFAREMPQQGGCLFLPQFESLVLASLSTPNGRSWQLVREGLYLEWTKNKANSREDDRYAGPLVYSETGRIYLPSLTLDDRVPDEIAGSWKALSRVFASIKRHIVKMSPLRSDEKHPLYVGPGLATQVEAGTATVLYANGVTEMPLVPNA